MTANSIRNGEQESSFIESESYSHNQIAIPTTNTVVANSWTSSSADDDWSMSEDDGKQVVQANGQQICVGNNEPRILSAFHNCNDVTNTTNTTHIYEQGVTVNKNFYCCPSSIDHVLKYCITRCCIVTVISILVAILIIVMFSMWLSNLKIRKQFTSIQNDTEFDIYVALTTISALPSSVITPLVATSINSYNDSNSRISNYTDWKIISRETWGATSYKKAPKKRAILPPSYIIISETETELCTTQQKCMENVRNKQMCQMKEGLDDIGYNFLVGGDGLIYEGRGWDVEGDHTEFSSVDYDDSSIDISFIGSFDIDKPTKVQLQAAIALIEYGVQNQKINADYKLKAQKQLTLVGDNPGDNLYNIIIMWKGWDSKTIGDFMLIEDYF